MAKGSTGYNWSDAWLLLAIIYAGGGGAANLERIIAAGDGINHAIFTRDELESGLARLTSGGYVEEEGGLFSATDKVMRVYGKTASRRRAVHTELRSAGKLIGAAPPDAEQPHANDLTYAGFSAAAYTEAVNKYVGSFAKK